MVSRHWCRADREWSACSRTIESRPPEAATKMDWPRRRSCRAEIVRSTDSTKSITWQCYWLQQARQAELCAAAVETKRTSFSSFLRAALLHLRQATAKPAKMMTPKDG